MTGKRKDSRPGTLIRISDDLSREMDEFIDSFQKKFGLRTTKRSFVEEAVTRHIRHLRQTHLKA